MEMWVVSISVDQRCACLLRGGGSTEAFVEEHIIQQQEGFFSPSSINPDSKEFNDAFYQESV